jgi:hypothetical protein
MQHQICFCNIHMKHMQHTYGRHEIYCCNMCSSTCYTTMEAHSRGARSSRSPTVDGRMDREQMARGTAGDTTRERGRTTWGMRRGASTSVPSFGARHEAWGAWREARSRSVRPVHKEWTSWGYHYLMSNGKLGHKPGMLAICVFSIYKEVCHSSVHVYKRSRSFMWRKKCCMTNALGTGITLFHGMVYCGGI